MEEDGNDENWVMQQSQYLTNKHLIFLSYSQSRANSPTDDDAAAPSACALATSTAALQDLAQSSSPGPPPTPVPWTRSWHIRRCMSVVLDVRQNSDSTVSPYRRTRCVPPGVGAARGVLEADAEAEAEAAVAVEEERIRVADPPPPAPALGGRPRADRAGVRAMAVDDDSDAPVRSSVMLWDDATSADAAAAALLVVVLPIPALADLPALNDDDDGTALPVFSLSGGG